MNQLADTLCEIEHLQNLLLSRATGGVNENDVEYKRLRSIALTHANAPRFLKTYSNLSQFWQYIKKEFATYAERKTFIWNEFRPLLNHLQGIDSTPSDTIVSEMIDKFDSRHLQLAWSKALERCTEDPEGAITMARTLLESTFKHILDEAGIKYEDKADFNKLYSKTSTALNLSPSGHPEKVFKQILGGCTTVIEGLASLRNSLSDSHGRNRSAVKPSSRHAELAVNLSGAMATYLISTWDVRKKIISQ